MFDQQFNSFAVDLPEALLRVPVYSVARGRFYPISLRFCHGQVPYRHTKNKDTPSVGYFN
jgi:hypothetical protein